jgi:hypothetical protein
MTSPPLGPSRFRCLVNPFQVFERHHPAALAFPAVELLRAPVGESDAAFNVSARDTESHMEVRLAVAGEFYSEFF